MNITIDELLRGKETIIKNKHYGSTEFYVEPFLERMSKFTDDFIVDVQLPSQITTIGENQDITYNRVLVQAVLPEEFTIDEHDEVYGFLYGLDVRKPIVKFYRGHLNRACTNLTVFNPSWLKVHELNSEEPVDYTEIDELVTQDFDFAQMLSNLKNSHYESNEIFKMFGKWLDHSLRYEYSNGLTNTKLPDTMLTQVYKSLFIKEDSPYYVGIDNPTQYGVFNAFTQCITDNKKDIMNRCEKTLLVKQIMGI